MGGGNPAHSLSPKVGAMHIFDCNNYVRRMIEADKHGTPLLTIFNAIQNLPDIPLCVWDGVGGNRRRRDIYPNYKVQRKPLDPTIFNALNNAKALLSLSKAINIECPGWEGDDVIATLVRRHFPDVQRFHIHTTDVDMLQLERVVIDRDKAPVEPQFMRLYKTLVGDTSDNIPGIKGFGEKAWAELSDDYRHILCGLFEAGQPIDWSRVPMSKGSAKWISEPANERLVRDFWTIIGFFSVPDDELKFEQGINDPASAWRILSEFNT
jgi:5'-3' exonuclease